MTTTQRNILACVFLAISFGPRLVFAEQLSGQENTVALQPTVKPTEAAESKKPEPSPEPVPTGFAFGSYGRVGVSSDFEGGPGRQLNFVTHGPRLGEGPYVELDFYYRARPDEESPVLFTAITTLAFTEELFHFNGDWRSALAMRNLYVEASDIFIKGLAVWVGSRMYRGDDIYLLDFWPLDNLNTLGGGVHYRFQKTWVAWQVGVNRLRDAYQYQEVEVPGLDNTSETIVLLNRQRYITSLKAEQIFGGDDGALGSKVKIYGEYHHIGEGALDANRPEIEQEHLMADFGWLVGAEYALWNFGPHSHVNLFVHYARGLAAYGEFAIPFGLDEDKRAKRAEEFLAALSGNWEYATWLGLQVGSYLRYFKDADRNTYDWDDGWEYVVAARPHVFLHRHAAIAAELSYQTRNPAGLNPWTHEKEIPGTFKASLLPMLTFERGTYSRPHLRLIYTLTYQNEAARDLYNPIDPRHDMTIGHYIGLQAEWWFNSTYR